MLDLLFKGGWVVDGLGTPAYRADVGVAGGKISAVGDLDGAEAVRTIDCQGLCVSPGWVDIHGHADWSVLEHPIGLNLLIQGCTLTVAGNCGGAPAPVCGRASEMLRRAELRGLGRHEGMYQRVPGAVWDMAAYLDEVERERPGVNYVQLAGHNQLRKCVMGDDPRKAAEHEVEEMARLLEQSLDQGAFGMSSGLVFIPGCWSDTQELIALAKVVARYDGLYASHIRGERETNIQATQEFIDIAEQAGVRGQMSHMQSKYPVYGNNVMKMELLAQARQRGVDVTVDSEAFPDCSATPGSFLQIYHYTPDQLAERLRDPESRSEIKRTMRSVHPWHPLGRFGPGGVPFRRAWDRVIIWDCPHDQSLRGRSVAGVAALRGIDSEDVLFDLALAEGGRGPRFVHDYIEDDHFRTASWEHCIFPSVDTGLYDPAERLSALDLRYWLETRYPGTIGLFPRVLGQFVREEKLMTLEEAVRKMTSLAVQRLGIVDRGVIGPGMWADLVVFDRDTVALRSAVPDPEHIETFYPAGIHYLAVNGQIAMEGHCYTGARAGHVLRKRH
ncbi:MAG: amidohydrolase family protein [Chloroflexi bacterium]|nr:amidohydrolase family protein [Chloroflexota bacterium]MBL7199621.1 amidohydrolase family protein [Anaerolineae bacterium]